MRKSYPGLLLWLSAIIWISCTTDTSDMDPDDPFIIGFITEIEVDRHRILIEENVNENEPLAPGGNKIWLSVNSNTQLLIELEDGTCQKGVINAFSTGSKAKGWVTGAVAESYPLQGTAKRIVQFQLSE